MHILFLLLTVFISADPYRVEFTAPDNETLVYYLDRPSQNSFPIVLSIEGSLKQDDGPQSVLRLHQKLRPLFLKQGIALITMERRGADGLMIDQELFHRKNFPSQRLADHKQLIYHLRQNPPQGWNGDLVILGGSEGGPIAIKLAQAVSPDGCVVMVGCTDQTFKEYIWEHIQTLSHIFSNQEEYETQITIMKNDPDPKKWWYGQTFRYWADALDQSSWREFLSLKCPILVISGSKDTAIASTDRLISKAKKLGQNVSYWKIEGMGHAVLDPRWNILEETTDWIQSVFY